jgi:primosomal protein N' (replication factor Y)
VVEAHAAQLGGVLLYPPVPTAVQKVANVERAQMLIEAEMRPALLRLLQAATQPWLALAQKNRPNGLIRWAVDVDPLAI